MHIQGKAAAQASQQPSVARPAPAASQAVAAHTQVPQADSAQISAAGRAKAQATDADGDHDGK